jgi:hypothetical protein
MGRKAFKVSFLPYALKFDGVVALRFSYVCCSKSHSLLRNMQTEYEVEIVFQRLEESTRVA